MFLDYYRLREQPFGVTPDPRYLYLSRGHREALASLYYGIDAGRGFMALISGPGMGKTTLLFRLLERLRKSACAAFLFQTQCDSRELLRYLLADMGLESRGQDLVELHAQLNQALISMSRARRRFVLVIDEAQNLDNSVLETVRLLSDFETPSSKLIQIVLSGQPQLADKLASPSLVQLRQRIAVLARLEPFRPEETDKYIEHRLSVAGRDRGQLFTSEAKSAIAAESQGIPRNINNLCFNSLSLGCAFGRRKIDRDIVLEAARDLDVETLGHTRCSAQVDVCPTPGDEPPSTSPSKQHQGFEHGLLGSLGVGVALCLVSLLLFQPVRQDFRNLLTKAWAPVLPVVKSIDLYHHTSQPDRFATFPAVEPVVGGGALSAEDTLGHSSDTATSVLPALLPVAETVQLDRLLFPPAISITRSLSPKTVVNRASGAVAPAEGQAIIYTVQPGKTLSKICVDHYGRFNRQLVRQILALNPKITDPNHIQVGQLISLPRGVPTSKRNNAVHAGDEGLTVAARY